MTKRKRTTAHLRPEVHQLLKSITEQTGIPQARLIEDAVKLLIKERFPQFADDKGGETDA